MNEQTRETLSALVDGELTATDISRAVDCLTQSDDLCECWDRYHVIGDVIRGEAIRGDYQGVAARVKEHLRDEPTVLVPRHRDAHRFKPHWLKSAAGTALAASVAVVALLTAPQLMNESPSQPPLKTTTAKHSSPQQLYAAQSGTHWNLSKPDVESKLNAYLVNHQEYATSHHVKGMLPYVTFVSYDAGR